MTVSRDKSAVGARREGHFRQVDVAAGIDPNSVRGKEISRGAWVGAARPAGAKFSGVIENAQAAAGGVRTGRGNARPHSGAITELGDINVSIRRNKELARPREVGPFAEILAFGSEKLDTA